MSDPIKPVPEGANQLQFFKDYLEVCQQQLPAGSTPLNIQDMIIANRAHGDGKWQILCNDPGKDFFCSTEIDWVGGEMSILSGKLSKKNPKTVAVIEMTDPCSATKKLLGDEELAGLPCVDAKIDPNIEKAKDSFTVQTYKNTCTDLMGKFTTSRYRKDFSKAFDLNRVRLVNDYPQDGAFELLYESKRYDFFCEGKVDSVGDQRMIFRHGSLKEKDTTAPDRDAPLTDACTVTTMMLGAEELVGECKDRKGYERNWEDYLTFVGFASMGILSNYAIAKLGHRVWKWRSVQAMRGWPLLRFAGIGYLSGKLFDSVSGQWLPKDDPVRKYGTYVAGGAGLVAPEILKRTVAKRLASTALLSRVGGIAVRIAGRAILVGLADWGASAIMDDYEESVQKRVTDRVYEKDNVYGLDGWDFLVLPLLAKGARGGTRWLAPSLVEWSVGSEVATNIDDALWGGHGETRREILAEDRKASQEGVDGMTEIFNAMKEEDPQVQAEFQRQLLVALNKPFEGDMDTVTSLTMLQTQGPEGLKLKGWNDEQIADLQIKWIVFSIQNNAKFMYSVKQDTEVNNWAREVFDENGVLKSGMEKKFLSQIQATIPEYIQNQAP